MTITYTGSLLFFLFQSYFIIQKVRYNICLLTVRLCVQNPMLMKDLFENNEQWDLQEPIRNIE